MRDDHYRRVSTVHWTSSLTLALTVTRYRRGKPQSSDVDLVFCPPKADLDLGLLKNLYLRLSAFGIITHVLRAFHVRSPAFSIVWCFHRGMS